MGAARDLFLEIGWNVHGNKIAHDKLCQAAELWRGEGQYFSAGIAMSRASDAAWGSPDRMIDAQRAAMVDFHRVIADQPPNSISSLAALHKLRQAVSREALLFETPRATTMSQIRELNSELAQRLLSYFGTSANSDGYLVRGVVIVTDLDGTWSNRFPAYEVPDETEQLGPELIMNIPSAFRLFILDGEWLAAYEIVKTNNGAFTTPGLRGWRAVTLANINPTDAMARFDEAAHAFATDTEPANYEDLMQRGSFWSSRNRDLWARYFRSRARLIQSIQNPTKVKELLAEAVDTLVGTEAGHHSSEVSRFNVLVKVLAKLVFDPLSFNADDARREYASEVWDETEEYRLAMRFISNADDAFRGFATDPDSELTRGRIGIALEALANIPVIGPDVAEVVRPAIGKSAQKINLGPVRSWAYRLLRGITDEASLRRVLLRLFQSGLPRYAQMRHGPIEYGKDIAILVEEDGCFVLRLYQVKCGDIDKKKWREADAELQEMFLVPMSHFQMPVSPERIEGILVTNGHANAYVEPVMEAWFEEQKGRGRSVQFMHIDKLVGWIFEKRLANELRAALQNEGITVVEAA
jgi:hypothetical protein